MLKKKKIKSMGCEYYGKYGVPNLSKIFYEDDILSQWEGEVCVCVGGGGVGVMRSTEFPTSHVRYTTSWPIVPDKVGFFVCFLFVFCHQKASLFSYFLAKTYVVGIH